MKPRLTTKNWLVVYFLKRILKLALVAGKHFCAFQKTLHGALGPKMALLDAAKSVKNEIGQKAIATKEEKMFFCKKRDINKFAKLICGLNGATMIGLAKYLRVKVFTEERDEDNALIPKDGGKIIEDCLTRFASLKRRQRKEILVLLNETVSEGSKHGSAT